jgi:hypothetical protein
MTAPLRVRTVPTNDRNRLALLWKAFEDAEERIVQLEAELDARRIPPTLDRSSTPPSEEERRKDAEARVAGLQDRLDESLAQTRRLEASLALVENVELRAERASRKVAAERWMRAATDAAGAWRMVDSLVAAASRLEQELAASRAKEASAEARASAPPRPRAIFPVGVLPLDDHRIDEIPGIREDEVARLRAFGVNFADALLYADLAALAPAARIGLPRLAKLRALSELMAIRGVGPEYADRLFRHGARTVRDVARLGTDGIARAIAQRGDAAPGDAWRSLHASRAAAIHDAARQAT